MRRDNRLPDYPGEPASDPREGQGAQIIDLATRNVLPAVSQRKPGREGLGLFAGLVVVGMMGAATFWSMDARRTEGKAPAQAAVSPSPSGIPAIPQRAITSIAPAPGAVPTAAVSPQASAMTAPAANPANTPTVVFDASALPGGPAGSSLVVPGVPAGPSGNGNEDFANRLGGVGGGSAVAAASFDPRTTVSQGTLIPAVLETAIDTDVPGYVRAVVSADVRSFDGSRVLVPRSSRLIGQYRSGLQAGQKRAYVIWTRLIRPDGVSVAIASPAVSYAGEAGLSGKVHTHFFERFGSAMLLSVVGGLSAIGGGAPSVVIAGSGQSAAAAAVGQTGQIGPTVRVRQGQPIRVFTARDLDFSKVGAP
ncbi:MAG TPA: TrbI/VirB10 family protein [Novosphingobium sp.]|nr:TrbI/VirB10 family protein [Novosphingobium sp.]